MKRLPVPILLVPLACACQGESPSTLDIYPRASLQALAGLQMEVLGLVIAAESFETGVLGQPRPKTIGVPNRGILEIGVTLTQGGRLAVEGAVAWELREDYEWAIEIFRSAVDPNLTCRGPCQIEEIPIQPWAAQEAGESLWIRYGGVPRGAGIVAWSDYSGRLPRYQPELVRGPQVLRQ